MTVDQLRHTRFEGLIAGYEAEGPDGSVPGASRTPERFAVITRSERWGYFVNFAKTLEDVQTVAAANIDEGWQPVCYYDLDALDGPEPEPEVGDVVRLIGSDVTFGVHRVGKDRSEGQVFDRDGTFALTSEVEIVERHPDNEDDRNPVRYGVAQVVTVVVFNTEPTR